MEEQRSHFERKKLTRSHFYSISQISQRLDQQLFFTPTQLRVADIHFSQRVVSERFQDGTSLSEVTQQLIVQKISAESIEPIRVVKHRGLWVTLDNRRLRVFKDAFIVTIPVQICYLKDEHIYREFHQKRTNKSSEGGGEIKTAFLSTVGNDNHFDDGSYIFTKKVLNLTFEQIMMPLATLKHTPSLAKGYNAYERESYYQGFLNLILEEARATLQTGIDNQESAENIPLTWINGKIAKNPENPSTLIFEKPIDCKIIFKSGDVLLLTHQEISDLRFIGMVGYLKENTDSLQKRMQVKIVLEEELRKKYAEASPHWNTKLLGSVITHSRMYEVCTSMPRVVFESQILTGNLSDLATEETFFSAFFSFLSKKEEEIAVFVKPENSSLNDSQCTAINKFLKLEKGIQLVQGPPGTGKTTMIVALLEILAKQGKRILVCAPSNKAVQLMAERFVSSFSEIPIILVGVEDKLPENPKLQTIFIHTWTQLLQDRLVALSQDLWELLPQEKRTVMSSNQQKKFLEKIQQTFLDVCQNLARYQFTFFSDLDKLQLNFQEAMKEFNRFLANPKLDFQKTETLQQVRMLLSQISQVFSHIENTLGKYFLDESQQGVEAQLLDHSCIIFSTLSVSGRKSFKNMKSVDILIIDEAGQAVEAETLIPLSSQPRKCLLIGDTKQLPATVLSPEAEAKGFGRSLLYRLLEDCDQSYTLLDMQYRMHPDISYWPSKRFYAGKIRDDDSVKEQNRLLPVLKNAPSFIAPYAFIHVEGQEQSNSHSFYNKTEAKLVEILLDYLGKYYHLNVEERVGVITFYKGQVDYLQKRLPGKYTNVKIQTVDSFQGCENDIIIISFVRSNKEAKIGFLKHFRRLNVALTRAKYSLIMLGDANTLSAGNEDLKSLVTNATERNCLFKNHEVQEQIMQHPQPKKSQPKQVKSIPCRFFNGKPNSCRKGENCDFAHISRRSYFLNEESNQ